jgi:anti-anti-sigma factor
MMAEISIQEDTVYLSGELKIKSIKPLWEQISQFALKDGRSRIILDLAGVTAIDSAGVALLDEVKTKYTTINRDIQLSNIH